jgi:hypothetical protein
MAADEITRVRYFERQFLRAADFRAEQTYDRDARRRHVLGHHTWGIVTGFALTEAPDGPSGFVTVTLEPGTAIDGFGRELVGYHPLRLDAELFDAFHAEGHHTVWIGYVEEQSGALHAGWTDCQDSAATRITEGWRLVASPPVSDPDDIIVDGAPATGVPADTSVPYQELPQGPPGDSWLIYVGIVHWDGVAQRFKPVDPAVQEGAPERRYVGAVAGHVVTPGTTLAVRRRAPLTTTDEEEFVTVEGRLRVEERLNAEREVWLEGDPLRFTYDSGDEDGVEVTLGRERPPAAPLEHQLRLRLGDPGAKAALSIGPGEGAAQTDVLRVSAEDVVSVPTGTLSFAAKTRQMLDLWATPGNHQYGIGVQSGTMYFRTDGAFCWFKGGVHDNAASSPGADGQLQLRLDSNADLHFGSRVRQMLNLWSTQYGIGIQSSTLYQRSAADFCWFRGGQHHDSRGNAGGGSLAMKLDDASNLVVSGAIASGADVTVGDDLVVGDTVTVGGDLRVAGHAPSVIKARRYERAVQCTGGAPATWTENVSADFSEVYEAFVVFNGFSIWGNTDPNAFDNFGHAADANAIVQHAYARVVSRSGTSITLKAFCSESKAEWQSDNSILLTLVVIGRTNP